MSTIMNGDGNYACVLLRNFISKSGFFFRTAFAVVSRRTADITLVLMVLFEVAITANLSCVRTT